jgi:hypothetical protein
MNVLLPLFYQSMFKFSRSSREFVSAFHAEGRRQWDTKCRITRLENRVSAILKPENPAAAGKYIDEHYILSPSDEIVLKNNISGSDKKCKRMQLKGGRNGEETFFWTVC